MTNVPDFESVTFADSFVASMGLIGSVAIFVLGFLVARRLESVTGLGVCVGSAILSVHGVLDLVGATSDGMFHPMLLAVGFAFVAVGFIGVLARVAKLAPPPSPG